MTMRPNLPFKISQNNPHLLVGRVLRAYSSLRSFPSSQRATNPLRSPFAITKLLQIKLSLYPKINSYVHYNAKTKIIQ